MKFEAYNPINQPPPKDTLKPLNSIFLFQKVGGGFPKVKIRVKAFKICSLNPIIIQGIKGVGLKLPLGLTTSGVSLYQRP